MARSRRKAVEATPASGVAKPAPRGRPTAERAAALDAVIRSAALEVFLAAGFAAASMDAIVAAAQVSKGTLYARFQGKEALFLSVLQEQREQLSDRASAFNHLLPADLEGRLRHHARTLIRAAHDPDYQRVVQLVESNAATFPDLARRWHELGTRHYLTLLAHNMRTASGAPPSIDWDFVADLFLHAISGWLRTQSAAGELNEARAISFSDETVAVVMAWIRERSRTEPNPTDP